MPGRTLYLPDADPGFHAWQADFPDYAVANAVTLGVSSDRVAESQAAPVEWDVGFDENLATPA
jgi:hypothetical protein